MPGKRLSYEVAQLIYNNHNLGKSVTELSEMFSASRRTIYNVINRAENKGRLKSNFRRTGRKSKISNSSDLLIMRKIAENPHISLRTVAKELKEEFDLDVSHETVRQVILRHKDHSGAASKEPMLSAINIGESLTSDKSDVEPEAEPDNDPESDNMEDHVEDYPNNSSTGSIKSNGYQHNVSSHLQHNGEWQTSDKSDSEYECELMGKQVASHFRRMRPDQRLFAERVISEVLVYGRLNRLSFETQFSMPQK